MKSMTGYGKGTAEIGGRKLSFEIKAVNNRYLEISCRLPKNMMVCDELIRNRIQARIERGALDIYFAYENNSEVASVIKYNESLAREYVRTAANMSESLGITNDFYASMLMRTPEVLSIETENDDEESFVEVAKIAIEAALDALDAMRAREGESIRCDLENLVGLLEVDTATIAKRAPKVVAEYRNKILMRVKDVLKAVQIDEGKLLSEVCFFADKCDINEELQRLTSHFKQFRDTINASGAVGKKLDFLAQEIHREINTIGSKSSDIELTNCVLSLKNNLEKIREQIRNVE